MMTAPAELLLDQYLAAFRTDFPRRDQFRWACEYVRGLRADLPRKNIETMARHSANGSAQDVGQALQNFINKSPWDEQRPLQRHRSQLVRRIGHAQGAVIFREIAFIKQGRHSVGVQRQMHPALGEKLNCQIAIGAHYVSAMGAGPLLLRLYLPASWSRQPERLAAAGVPPEHRDPISKSGLALRILDQLLTERVPLAHVLVAPTFAASAKWTDGLARAGFSSRASTSDQVIFSRFAEGALPVHVREAARRADDGWTRLREDLGLDHFEGRSWRGFHHHACLVVLAAGFGC
jgi:SRSO17 transposase